MLRVLLVDDDAACVRLIARILAQHGHVADAAHSADEAFALAWANAYDLVVCDFQLDDALGTVVLSVVRERSPRAMKVLITVHEDLPRLPEGVVDEIVMKPFAVAAIVDLVGRASERARAASMGGA